jgi:hypothetical protein
MGEEKPLLVNIWPGTLEALLTTPRIEKVEYAAQQEIQRLRQELTQIQKSHADLQSAHLVRIPLGKTTSSDLHRTGYSGALGHLSSHV